MVGVDKSGSTSKPRMYPHKPIRRFVAVGIGTPCMCARPIHSQKFDGLLAGERGRCLKRRTGRTDPSGMGNGGWRTDAPREHDRTPAEVAGFIDDVIVRVHKLTPDGASLLSPHAFEPGRTFDLVAELPLPNECTRATRLRLRVLACSPDAEATNVWRISGTVLPRDATERDALLEYWLAVSARTGRSDSGPSQPGAPNPNPEAELGFEELWLAVVGEAEA